MQRRESSGAEGSVFNCRRYTRHSFIGMYHLALFERNNCDVFRQRELRVLFRNISSGVYLWKVIVFGLDGMKENLGTVTKQFLN